MNHHLRARRVLLVTLSMLVLLAPSALAASVAVHINASTRVYEDPSTSARSVSVSRGLNVTLTDAADGWGQVAYKGYTAYIPLKYLTLNDPIRVYAVRQAAVYRSPDSGVLGQVAAGTLMYVVGIDGGFARVVKPSGASIGYIKASQLTRSFAQVEFEPQSMDYVPASLRSAIKDKGASRVEYAIFVAQNLIGAPYTESPDPPKTFDCSKFTAYCYAKAGATLQGYARAQGYDDRFPRVNSVSALKRGDLVCFDTIEDSDQSDHVGLYLGKGYFIHASSSAGKVVVSSLASGYYYQKFSWGRRIFD